jgi:hypothetical protein
MAGYAVAHVDEIEEFEDVGCHYRPIRHHLGISAFGVTAWTAHAARDVPKSDRAIVSCRYQCAAGVHVGEPEHGARVSVQPMHGLAIAQADRDGSIRARDRQLVLLRGERHTRAA